MKLYDVRAIARFLDVSERRVRQLRDEKVIAEVRPGLYDLIDTNHRYINYLRKRNPESEETIDYNTERAKLVLEALHTNQVGFINGGEPVHVYTFDPAHSLIVIIAVVLLGEVLANYVKRLFNVQS